MTRLGQITMSGAIVALALMLAVSTQPDRDGSRSPTWSSSQVMLDPDPGFWRVHPVADSAPRAYSVGMSQLAAMSRITVLPNSAVELTNLGASGAIVLESGGLTLTDAAGLIELKRGSASVATELAPVGIGSTLQRGDRLAFRSSATIAFRNPEETAASLLLITEIPDLPLGGVLQ